MDKHVVESFTQKYKSTFERLTPKTFIFLKKCKINLPRSTFFLKNNIFFCIKIMFFSLNLTLFGNTYLTNLMCKSNYAFLIL